MKRTSADGSTSQNLFTDGNPSTSVPATVLSAEYLNILQEELASVISGAGLVLDQNHNFQDPVNPHDVTQLFQAIKILSSGQFAQDSKVLLNNKTVAENLVGMILDKDKVKSVSFFVDIYRKTDIAETTAVGYLNCYYKPIAGTWTLISTVEGDDDHGMVFGITQTGQITYKSSNLAGSNYAGTLRVNSIKTLKV